MIRFLAMVVVSVLADPGMFVATEVVAKEGSASFWVLDAVLHDLKPCGSLQGEHVMAIKFHNPKSVSVAGKYSLGVEVPPEARVLYVSGQVGVDSAGKLQDGIEAQCDQVWKNIGEVLRAGGMDFRDIVKLTVFLTDSRFIPAFRDVRGKYVGQEPYPASTLLVVAGLADPSMLVEVEVIAAK